jgi:hypothetical protein
MFREGCLHPTRSFAFRSFLDNPNLLTLDVPIVTAQERVASALT